MRPELERVVSMFQRWLYLPDRAALLAVLGTVAANRLPGDPVWLLLVGPPGGGKSEILQTLGVLPDVHAAATLTEAALLSGTPKRERDAEAKGGLLRVIGQEGIIVCKDFGSVLSMHRDGRGQVLAALREIYDGSWTRHVGTDGGRTLAWEGKVGLIAGCTPTIDRHHAVMGAMGERFAFLRLPEVDSSEQARRAYAHAGREREMRRDLGEAVTALYAAGLAQPSEPDTEDVERLISLTTLVVRCRSSIERDSYSREIELIPEAEAPTRLIIVLSRLFAGLSAIGADDDEAWNIVTKVGLDSIPALRRKVMDVLLQAADELSTSKVAELTTYPKTTAERALEDLTAHGIALRHANGQGKTTTWTLSDWARERYTAVDTSPEKSDGFFTPPLRIEEDFSGEVAPGANIDQAELPEAAPGEPVISW